MHQMMIQKAVLIGTAFGKLVLPPLVPLGLFATDIINEQTAMPLALVAAVGGGCWYVGSAFQSLRDGQDSTHKRLSRIERKLHISEEDDNE